MTFWQKTITLFTLYWKQLRSRVGNRCGAEEACWAHNPKVGRSKLPIDRKGPDPKRFWTPEERIKTQEKKEEEKQAGTSPKILFFIDNDLGPGPLYFLRGRSYAAMRPPAQTRSHKTSSILRDLVRTETGIAMADDERLRLRKVMGDALEVLDADQARRRSRWWRQGNAGQSSNGPNNGIRMILLATSHILKPIGNQGNTKQWFYNYYNQPSHENNILCQTHK